MLHIFFIANCVTCEKKKNRKKCKFFFISVKPHCPFKHLRIYNSSLLIIFLKTKWGSEIHFVTNQWRVYKLDIFFLINFRRFKWGIKERFQLLTSPCILIFKEILLQLRALNGDNMVYILQCCYCSFMMYIIYMSSDLQHSVWWNKYRLLKCLVFIYLHLHI